MSDEQFKKFYWPTLKALILGLAEEGCVPFLFCEGGYNTRLEYLQELPKGSCMWIFDRTDMAKAKEMLGDRLCIGGNVPAGLILTGTAEKVRDYCKQLIDTAGKGGGYIMSFGTAMDEGKEETVRAMIDVTKEYGVYRLQVYDRKWPFLPISASIRGLGRAMYPSTPPPNPLIFLTFEEIAHFRSGNSFISTRPTSAGPGGRPA